MENNQPGVVTQVLKGKISLSRIYKAEYQKEGTLTAELKQEVVTKTSYPSKKVSNSMQDSIFGNEAFGFESQDFTATETRVAWIPVPSGATEEEVEANLSKAIANGATLYRVMSNKPILTEDQDYSIQVGNKTLADYAAAQVVRYPESHPQGGQLIKDTNGKVQYRRIFFKSSPMEDVDNRTADPKDQYISKEISMELSGASVIPGQTI